MYRYDDYDRAIVADRAAEFRDQVARRLSGEITEDQFKPLRLMNGLYLQLHAYMLRVAIPYGVFSSEQMRALARIARVYDRGYGHFTTRQNIQFNWIKLVDSPDILDELAAVNMHAIQTSGNCVRNITSDPLAGVAADEPDDPRVWSEVLRQWSTLHPEFSFLPRKFKIAINASAKDRTALKVHDIGLQIVERDGEVGFSVWVGGGQGRTPYVAYEINSFVPGLDITGYIEAILRVYNAAGRRDNLYKSRIKILVNAMGQEEFTAAVEEEFQRSNAYRPRVDAGELARIREAFIEQRFAPEAANDAAPTTSGPEFSRWKRRHVLAHKQPGYSAILISLKAVGEIPGDVSADQMDGLAALAERYSFSEIRATHEQNLVLPHVRRGDLDAVYAGLVSLGLETANVGLVSDIIACPGLDYCALANTRSIPIAQDIAKRFADLDAQENIGEIRIKISGCINACGHHHVGDIGILGVDKKDQEYYQILLGGSADENAAIGKIMGPALDSNATVNAIERIIGRYVAVREDGESFSGAVKRLGVASFKEVIYATA